MASTLVVPVARIGSVKVHSNAAMLCVANVLGYQVVTGLIEDQNGAIVRQFIKGKVDEKGKKFPVIIATDGSAYFEDRVGTKTPVPIEDVETIKFSFQHKEGDLTVYFPADTILTDEWAAKFNVKSLLKGGNRVGKIALRGEPSFGLVVKLPEGVDWKEGDNVASYFGCSKYEAPIKTSAGDVSLRDADIDPYFDKFTDIQNGRIFINVFSPGEAVVASEKLHGTCTRIGWVNGHQVAGSMELRRKPPENDDYSKSTYWFPWSIPGVAALLGELSKTNKVVELFGEVYGHSVQKGFKYDAGGGIGFRAFGLKVNNRFLNWQDFEEACAKFAVPMVPVLYKGPFDMTKIYALAEGSTTIGEAPLMEGVVVVPEHERVDPKVGRAILKYVSIAYSLSKHPESKDV